MIYFLSLQQLQNLFVSDFRRFPMSSSGKAASA
jgi:hypothetical protein